MSRGEWRLTDSMLRNRQAFLSDGKVQKGICITLRRTSTVVNNSYHYLTKVLYHSLKTPNTYTEHEFGVLQRSAHGFVRMDFDLATSSSSSSEYTSADRTNNFVGTWLGIHNCRHQNCNASTFTESITPCIAT